MPGPRPGKGPVDDGAHRIEPALGFDLDDFLQEEGIYEEATTAAIKKVIAWQLAEEMK